MITNALISEFLIIVSMSMICISSKGQSFFLDHFTGKNTKNQNKTEKAKLTKHTNKTSKRL